ncbi:MAG: hypothetical protein S4CHLAM45_15320 [Chlamydiales bacterium]|nr:hypothetical protein [Chlamydiales bacterium]MCH9620149.1 hypothetical protein [Chlamydiales bacterium]MCH9623619.1 hypothetical protein [Chlamydiales bacterium]
MKTLKLIDKAFRLKKSHLFGSLDLDLLLTIADKLGQISFREDEIIFSHSQDANQMYLIIEGSVSIDNSKKVVELGVGDFFGDESIFNEKPRAYTAKCMKGATMLTLTRNHLLGIIAECPSVAIALLEAYSANIDFRGCHL